MAVLLFVVALFGIGLGFAIARRRQEQGQFAKRLARYVRAEHVPTVKATTASHRVALLEDFAAELTDAAYAVAARHEVVNSSVDLELALWRALDQTVKTRGRKLLRAVCSGAEDSAEISG
jgi:hypothetical protein